MKIELSRRFLNVLSFSAPIKTRPSTAGRVLVVDDDPVILATTAARLSGAGYEVMTAQDASEALAAVAHTRPDWILLDVDFPPDVAHGGVPRWDGFRLMAWMRGLEHTKGSRFVVISGIQDISFAGLAKAKGAVEFFSKPFDMSRLLNVLQG
jgi:CheY-like chemotaxis protein